MLVTAPKGPPATPAAGSIHISVLGGFSLRRETGETIAIPNKKACGLLAYLTLSKGKSSSRERLAGLFWSDKGEDQARASLRQNLKKLREIFAEIDFHGFLADRQDVLLHENSVVLDVETTFDDLENGRLQAPPFSTENGPETILYGFEGIDETFASWLHVVRQTWQDRFTDLLQRKLESNSGHAAKVAAESLIAIDPTHEEAHRYLIRNHADSGNTAAALRQYKSLWDLLGDEYDMEPDQSTQELIAEIKAGTYAAASTATPTPTPTPTLRKINTPAKPGTAGNAPSKSTLPTIGVWNFVPGAPVGKSNYLIDGFRRELIAALVRFREWIVVEAGETLGGTADPNQSPAMTDYKLEGSYFEFEDQIQLVVTLKDTAQSRFIWSEQVDLSMERWIEAYRTIVKKVAISLNVYLSVDRTQRNIRSSSISPDIYDQWLLGQELSYRWRPTDEVQAEEIFRSIIIDVPEFAPAYSSLVQIMNSRHHIFPGRFRTRNQETEALKLAKRAVAIDPLDTRALLCLAWSYAMNSSFDKAVINYHLARNLNENDPWTLVSSALGLAYCGELEEARNLVGQAQQVGLDFSPLHCAYRAGVMFMCGDYEACIESAELAEDAVFYLPAWKSAALANLNRLDQAREEAAHFVGLIKENWYGPGEPSIGNIAKWLLHSFPIKLAKTSESLRVGLARAGISETGEDQ